MLNRLCLPIVKFFTWPTRKRNEYAMANPARTVFWTVVANAIALGIPFLIAKILEDSLKDRPDPLDSPTPQSVAKDLNEHLPFKEVDPELEALILEEEHFEGQHTGNLNSDCPICQRDLNNPNNPTAWEGYTWGHTSVTSSMAGPPKTAVLSARPSRITMPPSRSEKIWLCLIGVGGLYFIIHYIVFLHKF